MESGKCFFFFFLTSINRGNEREHIVKRCANGWGLKEDTDETWQKRQRVFDAERTDNPRRHLSEGRYADLFFFVRFFFLQISRCFEDFSHTSVCLLGVGVAAGQCPGHIHFYSL